MADLFVPNAFLRYFAATFMLAILPEFFLMYVRTSKVVSYNTKLCNFFIMQSIVNAFIVIVCAFLPRLPFSYVRNYIIICHAVYLFFVIAMFVNNSVSLSQWPTIPSALVIVTSVMILVDFTLYLVPPYTSDLFAFSRYAMLLYLITRSVEVINDFFSTQILTAREEMYRTVVVRDSLTGVHTRPAFWHFQKEFFTKNAISNDRLSLVLCEILNLKQINEKNGYEEGDEALKTTSQILKLNFSSEQIYRINGSCFGVLLVDMDEDVIQKKIRAIEDIIDDYNSNQDLGDIRLALVTNVFSTSHYVSFDHFLTATQEKLNEYRKLL